MAKLVLDMSVDILPESFPTNMMVLGAFFLQECGWGQFSPASQQLATILNERLPPGEVTPIPSGLGERLAWFTRDQGIEEEQLDSSEAHSLKSPVADGF